MYNHQRPSDAHLNRLATIQPLAQITVAEHEMTAISAAQSAEIILGHRYLRQVLPYVQRLRWVQSSASGIDKLPWMELAQKQVALTRMTVGTSVIAKHAVTLAWAITRRLPEAWQQQQMGVWNHAFNWLPFPQRALIFGTGQVGQAIARLLSAEAIEVMGVKRELTGQPLAEFSHLFDKKSFFNVLPQIDWCFLALPNTPETEHLIDENVLRALPSHAVLVNVGRGQTLNTADLCRVLTEGHLGGAALDVIDPQPTDQNDPIWKTPRLTITPWVSARYQNRWQDEEQFCETQLARFTAGQPLLNQVDLDFLMDMNNK